MISKCNMLPNCCHRHLGRFYIFNSIEEKFRYLLKNVDKHWSLILVDYHIHINPIVKLKVLCLLFACQNGNSHYSLFSFNVGRIGLVVPHCIVRKTKKDRGDVFLADDEHALTHTYSFFFPSSFFFSSFLHSASTMLNKTPSSSRSKREIRACRVENFIERDDEPTLGVLALRILFLHIPIELALLVRWKKKNISSFFPFFLSSLFFFLLILLLSLL
jgi:hypothetical protein